MSLKQKTIAGLTWSFIDSFVGQGIIFIVGIILARILSPREFGLVGMLTIFIAVSESFINSGFSSALIRKKECTQTDYSTVFFFNLAVGTFLFVILFFSAPFIGEFFSEPELTAIVRVFSIVLIIDSLTLIQRTTLTKRIDFKLQARISIIAATGSGVVAIYMACTGWGVWSLVTQRLSREGINSLLLWLWNKWKPIWTFSKDSFKELFGFSSKLLISGLIDTIYNNVYFLVIGKFFAAQELGYYTRADQFKSLPSQNLNNIIIKVSYPVLSSIQDDIPRLKETFKKIIRSTMLVTFVLMLGLAAVAEPMILTLIGKKWEPCVIYLQMLCFVGMLYPLHALNLNMLMVKGRSDLFLRLEIIKKALAVPVIVIAIFLGIKSMIFGMILLSLIAYYLNSYWSGRLIGYSLIAQVKDILPSFMIAALMSMIVFIEGMLFKLTPLPMLIVQITTGAILTVGMCEMFRFKDYLYIKEIVNEKLFRRTTP